ncbi:MAG TPA: GH1 family beta-glucosidase [Candidatus Acidoferrales bacterium]|nr:GH1 family beta-glucosidase [Candidatus Acidoferrales bacterium]
MARKDKLNSPENSGNSSLESAKPLTRREFLAGSASAIAIASLPAGQSGTPPQQQQAQQQTAPTSPAKTPFAADFLWGASTSAYQIEGASREDGKDLSVWDEFVRQPGAIRDGKTGDMACDFYHRYPEDIGHMREMGLKAFRFSVAWSRVIPQGTGEVNQKGLDFYSALVDALLAAGITPVVTLFHWDTPLALVQRGGWEARDMAGWFGDYAATVARSLSDRAKYWLTVNEPRSFIGGGYVTGVQAPGEKLPRDQYMRAAHITLLAHGRAVQAVRANAKKPVQIGCPCDVTPALPESNSSADVAAALQSTFASPVEHFSAEYWWRENSWWLDPIYTGKYPADAVAALEKDSPEIQPGDMETIHQPLDFLATNIYSGWPVRANPQGMPPYQYVDFAAGAPLTAFRWHVTPEALYWGPKWLYERYKLPIFITENGCSFCDWVSLDGQVHDPQRIDFTARYLQAFSRAVGEGMPALGYLHWSLLDNFEWQEGYTQRFGMIFVDFPTEKRILKDSAHWYASVISSQGAALQRIRATATPPALPPKPPSPQKPGR